MSPTLVNQSKCYAIILLLSLRAFKKGNIQLQQFSNQTFYIMALQTKDNLSRLIFETLQKKAGLKLGSSSQWENISKKIHCCPKKILTYNKS